MNFANSNYRTVLKQGSGLTKLTINGVAYFPTEDGELLLPSNFATTDQLFSGDYNDLINKPTIPAAQVPSDWAAMEGIARILNKPALFSGDYNDLSNKPVIPAAQVSSDWNATAGVAQILNKPDLSPLATAIQSAINIGTATGVYVDKQTTSLRFRTIRAGDNVTISVNAAGEIVIAAAGSSGPAGESNTASSLGGGTSLVAPKNGVDLPFRSLLSSAGLTWSQQTDTVTLTLHQRLRDLITGNLFGLGSDASNSIPTITNFSQHWPTGMYQALGDGVTSPNVPTPNAPVGSGNNRLLVLAMNYLDAATQYFVIANAATPETKKVFFGNYYTGTTTQWVEATHSGNQSNLVTVEAAKGFPFINLMQDSGRFNGLIDPLTSRTSTDFYNVSSFLTPYNGSTIADGGEAIFDNNNNGGTSGTMNDDVVALTQAMGTSTLRYFVEFHIATLTQGSGTAVQFTASNGIVTYLSTVNNSQALFAANAYGTYVGWMRAKTGTLTFRSGFYLNGELKSAGFAIIPDMGWVHIRLTRSTAAGYDNAWPGICASTSAQIQIALPAFFNGSVDPGIHKSPIPTSPVLREILNRLEKSNPRATGQMQISGSSEPLRLVGSSDAANFLSIYENGTRKGYIGRASGSNSNIYVTADAGSVLLYDNGAQKLTTTTTGISVTGTMTATSDRKFKSNIRSLKASSALSRLMQLKVRTFFFSLLNKDFSGFIAQEVKKIYPNSVDKIKGEGGNHLVMAKDEIIADLVAVVQDQQRRLDRLEDKLDDSTK